MGAERRGGKPHHRRFRRPHLIGAGIFASVSVAAAVIIGVAVAASSMNDAGDAPRPTTPSVHGTPQNHLPGITVPKPAHMPSNLQQAAMVKRGRYLVIAGDCAACHSVPFFPATEIRRPGLRALLDGGR